MKWELQDDKMQPVFSQLDDGPYIKWSKTIAREKAMVYGPITLQVAASLDAEKGNTPDATIDDHCRPYWCQGNTCPKWRNLFIGLPWTIVCSGGSYCYLPVATWLYRWIIRVC